MTNFLKDCLQLLFIYRNRAEKQFFWKMLLNLEQWFPNFYSARSTSKILVIYEAQKIHLYCISRTTWANLEDHKWSVEQTLGITDLFGFAKGKRLRITDINHLICSVRQHNTWHWKCDLVKSKIIIMELNLQQTNCTFLI